MSRYGWIPDVPDKRDFRFSAPALEVLPPIVDLSPSCPPILDQGKLGSCTAHALANAHLFDQMRQKRAEPVLSSRLFIYYQERVIEGTVPVDAGAMLRDGMKVLANTGAPPEPTWAYRPERFAVKPSKTAYKRAGAHQALEYRRLAQTTADMRGCLASGFPFVFGFTVYSSFESAAVERTGDAPLPAHGEVVLGGHAVMAVGYDDVTQRIKVMNSWGTSWGDNGFFTLPYAYLTDPDLAADFWMITAVEQHAAA